MGRAMADESRAIELNPNFGRAYFNRGTLYYKRKDWDQALANYTKVLEIDPKDAEAYSNRGLVYYKKGDLERALADFAGPCLSTPMMRMPAIIRRCSLARLARYIESDRRCQFPAVEGKILVSALGRSPKPLMDGVSP